MSREMNDLSPHCSLHKVKDAIQLRFMGKQAKIINDNLDEFLALTWDAAPVRKISNQYSLTRKDTVRTLNKTAKSKDLWMEKHWEEACFWQWREKATGLATGVPFRRIISYQVMLRDNNENQGWGEIDLIGENDGHMPVIVELKSKHNEYILRAIIEAVAYGVAIRKAWNSPNSQFRKDWAAAVGQKEQSSNIMSISPLAVAAPTQYWDTCLSKSPKRIKYQTPQTAISEIGKLLESLRSKGYPISFIEIVHEDKSDTHGLPVITGANCRELL